MYDVIVIGAGPAGLTAGIYASRARLSTLIIDKAGYGGQMAKTWSIENYPGFKSVNGFDLGQLMHDQAIEFGCELVYDTIKTIEDGEIKKILCDSGKTYEAKAVIIASGTQTRKLGCKGEEQFSGKGVSYCGTCDGAFFKEKHIITVGGGDTAVDEAFFLTRFAKKVTMVHRSAKFNAEQILIEKVEKSDKIDIMFKTEISEIQGDNTVSSVILKNRETDELKTMNCEGVFIFIGSNPSTEYLKDVVKLNDWGYVITDEHMKAVNNTGIYACGDCRENVFKQVVVACGEGAIAAHSAENFLRNN